MNHYPNLPVPRSICVTALVSAFRVHRSSEFYFSGESHDFYELVIVLSGKALVTAAERVYLLESGQCVLHPPMEFHRLRSAEQTEPEFLILSFRADRMPPSCGGRYALSPRLRLMAEEWIGEIDRGFCRSASYLIEAVHDAAEAELLLLRLELILAELLHRFPKQLPLHHGSAASYTEIVQTMKQHLSEPLTADRLALYCRMSKSNLKRIFSHYSGVGIMHYFMQMKMDRACELLANGESVGTTARLLGFSDRNYFSTVFHRIVGMPPREYKP